MFSSSAALMFVLFGASAFIGAEGQGQGPIRGGGPNRINPGSCHQDNGHCDVDTSEFEINPTDRVVQVNLGGGHNYVCREGEGTRGHDADFYAECTGEVEAGVTGEGTMNAVVHDGDLFASINIGGDNCLVGINATGGADSFCIPEADMPDRDKAVEFVPEDDGGGYEAGGRSRGLLRKLGSASSKGAGGLRGGRPSPGRRGLMDDSGGNIDIMVPWSRRAECYTAGLGRVIDCNLNWYTEQGMRGRIDLAIRKTNRAFHNSGINTTLRLAHAYRDEHYVEPFLDDTDMEMVLQHYVRAGVRDPNHEMRRLRYAYGADLVAMIVETQGNFGGLGYLCRQPSEFCGLSAIRAVRLDGLIFAHEIGHNLGCHHDRGTDNSCKDSYNGYGYRDTQGRFRSIMAYSCRSGQCDNINITSADCHMRQFFSNQGVIREGKFAGLPMGDVRNDCASIINANLERTAQIMPFVTISPTTSPTISPTTSPTTSPTSSPTSSPTYSQVNPQACSRATPPAPPAPAPPCVKIQVNVWTDNYPSETKWNVKDFSSNQVLFSGGPYNARRNLHARGNLYEHESECLKPSLFTFTIEDSYGDGICCRYGSGGYEVFLNGVKKGSGGSFGYSETVEFESTWPRHLAEAEDAPPVLCSVDGTGRSVRFRHETSGKYLARRSDCRMKLMFQDGDVEDINQKFWLTEAPGDASAQRIYAVGCEGHSIMVPDSRDCGDRTKTLWIRKEFTLDDSPPTRFESAEHNFRFYSDGVIESMQCEDYALVAQSESSAIEDGYSLIFEARSTFATDDQKWVIEDVDAPDIPIILLGMT